MNRLIKKNITTGLLASIVAVTYMGIGSAATVMPELARPSVTLFSTQSTPDSDVELGGWGSGQCARTNAVNYRGAYTLQIISTDLYTGGRISFKNAVDLTSVMNDPEAYLQLSIRFGAPVQTGLRPGGFPGVPGGEAMPGAPKFLQNPPASNMSTRYVRAVLVLDSGLSLVSQAEIATYKQGADGWRDISIPLSAFKGKLKLPAYKVQRVILGTDGYDAMFLSDIRAVADMTPLRAMPGSDRAVSVFDRVVFNGSFNSGGTAAKLSWDFDASDGIQEEAIGPAVGHMFKMPGIYTVTLTATDPYGVKSPAPATIKIKVNP